MAFHQGDRVYLLVDYPDDNHALPAMSVGTVVGDDSSVGFTSVRWDNEIGGHDCDGLCEWGHGWNVSRHSLVLVETEEIDEECIADMSEFCAFIGI